MAMKDLRPRTFCTPASALLSAMAIVGCSGSQQRPGFERAVDQDAVVVTGVDRGAFVSRQVRITRISGPACAEGGCANATFYVRLRPGVYDFEVEFVPVSTHITHVFAIDLTTFITDEMAASQNEHSQRRITFAVEAGKAYEIHFDPEGSEYWLSIKSEPAAMGRRPVLLPPHGAFPCLPGSSSRHVSQCTSDR